MELQRSTSVDTYLFEPFRSAATLTFRRGLVPFLGPCNMGLSQHVQSEEHRQHLSRVVRDHPVIFPSEKG